MLLFYYQNNLAFFCKKAIKHQVTKKEPKTPKKIIFFSSCVRRGECPLCGFVLNFFCSIAALGSNNKIKFCKNQVIFFLLEIYFPHTIKPLN